MIQALDPVFQIKLALAGIFPRLRGKWREATKGAAPQSAPHEADVAYVSDHLSELLKTIPQEL